MTLSARFRALNGSPHVRVVALAFFVTFLWSTSWVLIKFGLEGIPALVVLGLLLCSVTQGAQFLNLFYLPGVTTSLRLSFTSVVVALLGLAWLKERPTWLQWGGTALYLAGVLVYFYPAPIPAGEVIGLIVVGVCVLGNALSAILGRHINHGGTLEPMTVTVVSMGIGSIVLLAGGTAVQGLPRLTLTHWAIIAWLAAVNSALAYTLWNRALPDRAAGVGVLGRTTHLAKSGRDDRGSARHARRSNPQAAMSLP